MISLIATIASVVIAMIMFGGFLPWAQAGVMNVQTAAMAMQQNIVNKAAAQYVQDAGVAIAALATASTPTTISVQTLINAGYLPNGFSTTNAFGQLWQVQVLQPSSGVLETVVESTGGRAITDTRQLVQIAAQAGAQGGFIPYAGQNGNGAMSPTSAYGAYGAWGPIPLTTFANPGSGHLFSLLAFTNTNVSNGYLYRVQVPNHPELNAMQTDLGMTDTGGTKHNITGAATAAADTFQNSGGGQFSSDQGGSLELGGNNGKAGTGTPYVDFHLGGQGIQDFNARVQNDSNGHLTVLAANGQGSLQVQGTIQTGNIAVPETTCSPNGITAGIADGSGMQMTCLNGLWVPTAGHWQLQNVYTVANGSFVPAPACSMGGVSKLVVAAQNIYVDPTATVNFGPASGTGPWSVNLVDGNGNAIPGQGQAATYCVY
jgi:hypothetical protein